MADLPYLAARLYNRPHLVTPAYAQAVSNVLAARMGVEPAMSVIDQPERRPYTPSFAQGVLTIPIVGGVYHRGDALDAMSGSTSYTHLTNVLTRAVNDGWQVREGDKVRAEPVKGVLFDIDSPGGEGAGCFEFCEFLTAIPVPKVAVANAQCCSAAYAIASAADKIWATPSADVGSVGVYIMHTDLSAAMAKKGVKVTFIHAGAQKVSGNPFEPLPEAVRAEVQGVVDDHYDRFVSFVAAHRPMSAEAIRATEARTYGAEKALALGLVDAVGTYEQARSALAADVNRKTHVKIIEGVPVTWPS